MVTGITEQLLWQSLDSLCLELQRQFWEKSLKNTGTPLSTTVQQLVL